jgi:hypothetical protein
MATPRDGGSDIRAASAPKTWGGLPRFDPLRGAIIRAPDGVGPGYWVGAPTATRCGSHYYLCYRVRRPRPERGVEGRIAVSDDGLHFEDIFRLHKSALETDSIERCCLFQTDDGLYHYAVSSVDPEDGRWRTDILSAPRPDGFSSDGRRPVLTAADINAEGVKDPNVYRVGGLYWMLLSYAPRPASAAPVEAMHATGDVYNTGLTRSHSGMATSPDGRRWRWIGDVLSPSENGWDAYAARLGSVVYTPPAFVGLYDGSRDVGENYEECCGLAMSLDLRHWERLTPDGPWVVAPHGSGSVRYVDVLAEESRWLFYFEMARADGSHDLRVAEVPRL